MDKRAKYLINRLQSTKAKFKENDQLWFELLAKANPGSEVEANGRRTEEVYNHTLETIKIELLFLQLEIELLKMGSASDVSDLIAKTTGG